MASITASTTILDSYAHARIARLEEQVAELLQAVVNRGGQELAKAPVKKPAAAGRPKKEILAAPPKPEDGDDAPDAADYRLTPSDITEDVCVGRILKGNEDKRWSPAVYSESQCGGDLLDGDDLCKTCRTRADKFAQNPAAKSDWNGRVTEEPLGRCHMLGTAWALETSFPKWKGGAAAVGGAGTDTASIVSSSDSSASGKMSVAEAKAVAKATKDAEKAAAKAAKDAEKAATKAAKDAEKAATKAAKDA